MVNADILNYLKEGKKRGFTLNILKQKLIEGGFDEKDVNEATMELQKSEFTQPSQPTLPSMNSSFSQTSSLTNQTASQTNNRQPMSSKGAAWLKISGILGIALLAFITIFSFIVMSLQNTIVL